MVLPQYFPFLLLLFSPTCLPHYKTYVVPRENSKSFTAGFLESLVWPVWQLALRVDGQGGAVYTKTLKGSIIARGLRLQQWRTHHVKDTDVIEAAAAGLTLSDTVIMYWLRHWRVRLQQWLKDTSCKVHWCHCQATTMKDTSCNWNTVWCVRLRQSAAATWKYVDV